MSRRRLPPLALAYHGVGDVALTDDPHHLFMSRAEVRRHVARLRAWGYALVRFGDLAARAASQDAAGHAALTFDDGLVDNLELLVPLLDELDAPATVFVVSGLLGEPHPDAPWTRLLTGEEVSRLHAAGIEVGAHSATHRDLTALTYDEAFAELAGSKRALEALIDAPVDVASYPYGAATEETIAACRAAGFRAACRASGEGSWAEPLNLPRQDMDRGSSLLGLRLKRAGRYESLMRYAPARAARRLARSWRAMAE